MDSSLEITNSKVQWDDRITPPAWLTVVDVVKKKYWANNYRTFIFVQPDIQELTNERLTELLFFMGDCHADEFSVKRVHKQNIIRLSAKWWAE